jgi:hypothetical protein
MALHTPLCQPSVAPAQVWLRLAADLRQQTIGLMAQLAYNFVTAQPAGPVQEAQACSLSSQPIKSVPNISTAKP